MVSFRQLMSTEMLDELLPTHEFFRVIDRRVILKSESDLPLPSDRFMVICVEANEEWLPEALTHLAGQRWMTGPDLPTYLGISSYTTRVAVCGQYVYVCSHIGA